MESNSESDFENIDNLVTQIGNMDLRDNFINIKPIIKTEEEWNPNISDIPSTSRNINRTTPTREARTHAGIKAVNPTDHYLPESRYRPEPISPFGVYLDLDCVKNPEEVIDKWETGIRLAITINKYDWVNTKGFIEKTMLKSVQRFWDNIDEEQKKNICDTNLDVYDLITKISEIIRLEFCGEGKIVLDPNKITKYDTALLRLTLCDICEIEKYICVFQDYYYHIYNKGQISSNYLQLFFAKIPDPWGKKLIETYNPGNVDSLGKRIAHVRNKLSNWCADAILAKASRGIRKRISLCCDNPKMPIMIGCDSPYYYGKIKRRYKKRKYYKRRYFKKRKVRYYKKRGYNYKKDSRSIYKRNNKMKKPYECRCYYCKELGHYANKCPKKFDKNKKKFEVDEDIENMINNEEFVLINNFEDIDSEESIFILTETDYTSEEE